MQANARIEKLFARLRERDVDVRRLWSAKRHPDSKHDDVFMVSFSGSRLAIGTAIIIDYGVDGYGFFPESRSIQMDSDVGAVMHGNAMQGLMLDLGEFNRVMGVRERATPGIDPEAVPLIKDLITEEQRETFEALDAGDIVEAADGFADLIYVTVQAARKCGIPLDRVWAEVQRSNMAKVDPATGRVIRRPDGKILKPAGWTPPDIAGALQKKVA